MGGDLWRWMNGEWHSVTENETSDDENSLLKKTVVLKNGGNM
jgi:hypothetical protein